MSVTDAFAALKRASSEVDRLRAELRAALKGDDPDMPIDSPPYVCIDCGERGVPTMAAGERCLLCGGEQVELFRAGWDESD